MSTAVKHVWAVVLPTPRSVTPCRLVALEGRACVFTTLAAAVACRDASFGPGHLVVRMPAVLTRATPAALEKARARRTRPDPESTGVTPLFPRRADGGVS